MTISVFHPGELEFQRLAGTRGVADELAGGIGSGLSVESKVSSLFSNQRFAWLSTLAPATLDDNSPTDDRPRVWVSVLFGKPGFIKVTNDNLYSICSDSVQRIYQEIFRHALSDQHFPISFLAIDLEARRRFRTNGYLESFDSNTSTLTVKVSEAFGNCPKYIQKRIIAPNTEHLEPSTPVAVSESRHLTEADVGLISSSDALFFGTYYERTGMDVNHRGGQPGFVRVVNKTELFWPEYRGNGMFQSSGNLQSNDRAGVTFFDFASGVVLQLTGRAVIEWSPHLKWNIESACERVVQFFIDKVRRTEGPATNFRWKVTEMSPYSPDLPSNKGAKEDQLFPMTTRLIKIVNESDNVKTFRFLAPKMVNFLPGQYATFEFENVEGLLQSKLPIVRTWTLSEAANSLGGDVTLEASVKRIEGGLISCWLHDRAKLGTEVKLRGIGGEMTPFVEGKNIPKKILLISGGIGITPNMAILRGLGSRLDASLSEKPDVIILHQERQLANMPFQKEIYRRVKNSSGKFRLFVFLTRYAGVPLGAELATGCTLKQNRITETDVEEIVDDVLERHIYLCGPLGFMKSIRKSLSKMGVSEDKIFSEKFDF